MNLMFKSTRNEQNSVTASQAIVKGIADDGGLFIPEKIPKIDFKIEDIVDWGYQELAYNVLKLILSDFTKEELEYCINGAYDEKFDTNIIAPLKSVKDVFFLELFHGKTLAFKDMALSILPYLLKIAARKNGVDEEIVILTATSGDTGKAALEGFADVDGTKIIVFFPEDGVSPVQKRQMITQKGKNTFVAGIKGNFDDAQTGVKKIFADKSFSDELKEKGYIFSSANSINIGRLAPQIVYYFYSYAQMLKSGNIKAGDKINFTVPTGNFGNILAGFYAEKMGLPINRLVCASNENKVLYDFFKTGKYDVNRKFIVTVSPSMDILISSNLERFLYHMCEDAGKTRQLMDSLNKNGNYKFDIENEYISAEYADVSETFKAIKNLYDETGYIMDTHTAVAYAAYNKYKNNSNDDTKNVIVSTASPFKFAKDVCFALNDEYKDIDPFDALKILAKLNKSEVPAAIKNIDKREILHKDIIEKDGLKDFIISRLV